MLNKIIYFFLFVILIVSCNENSNNLSNSSNYHPKPTLTQHPNVTGEQAFRALFFLEGDIPNEMSSLSSTKTYLDSKISSSDSILKHELCDSICSAINSSDPTFFSKFRDSLASDNLYNVQQTLILARDKYKQVASQSSKYGDIFKFGLYIASDSVLLNKVKNLDVETIEGKNKLDSIISDYNATMTPNRKLATTSCSPCGAVCVVYIVAAVVSYVVGIYTLVTVAQVVIKVAYWGLVGSGTDLFNTVDNVSFQTFVTDIANYF